MAQGSNESCDRLTMVMTGPMTSYVEMYQGALVGFWAGRNHSKLNSGRKGSKPARRSLILFVPG